MKDKRDLILDAVGDINPKFVEEYEGTRPEKRKAKILRLSAAAAMLLLTVSLSAVFLPKLIDRTVPPPDVGPQGNIAGLVISEKRGDFDYISIIGSGYVADLTKDTEVGEMAIDWASTVKSLMKGGGIVVKGYVDAIELYQKPHPNGKQYNGFAIAWLSVEEIYHDGSNDDPHVKVGDRIPLFKHVISYGEPGFDNINKDNELAFPYQSKGVYYLSSMSDRNITNDEYVDSEFFPDGDIWWGLSSSVEIFEKNR